MKTHRCSALQIGPNLTLYHTGPALDHGPLPSIFYFALSGPDSLTLDPYNQPVQFLHGEMVRFFSMTLPGHENNLPATGAMQIWKEDLSRGVNCVANFLDDAQLAVEFAVREKFADPNKMGVAGLSRGGFIAAHLAARDGRFRKVLAFAPLTKLSVIKEFAEAQHLPLANSLDLIHLAPLLADRHVRLYIGNDDTRVGTKECFDFASAIVKHKKTRISHVELSIFPSIGQMGHGTPPEIFKQGAVWIYS